MNASESVIQHYLDSVSAAMTGASQEQRDVRLGQLHEHINEMLAARTVNRSATSQDVYAVLAEMDPPEKYSVETAASSPPSEIDNHRLVILSLSCSLLQIIGLVCVLSGVPIVGSVAGLAAVVNFVLNWVNRRTPRWLLRLTGVAAACGVGTIIIDIAKAM